MSSVLNNIAHFPMFINHKIKSAMPNLSLQLLCMVFAVALLICLARLVKVWIVQQVSQHKKASNHHANLPLEMYSFTL